MTSFAQTGRQEPTCYCCGKKGHKSTECRHQNTTPKSEWWFHKALQNYQEQQPDAGTNNQSTQNNDSDQHHRSVQRTNSARTEQASRRKSKQFISTQPGMDTRREGKDFKDFKDFNDTTKSGTGTI